VPFHRERLANGLDVVAETSAAAVSTSLGFFVRCGARDETDAEHGVSHFLEHMVFKGTAEIPGDEINRRFDALGAAANAFTSEEDTVYYATVLPERQDEALDLLARMMRPALRTADFDTEKLVILEEIRMYDDQPPFGADERCRAAFFGRHPLSRNVLGTVESIGALPVEAMRDYHRRRYAPGSIVLAAAGAVDFAGLVSAARRLCGDWEPGASSAPAPKAPRGPAGGDTVEHVARPGAALAYATRLTPGPAETDADRFAAKLLATVLGDGSGSRLYWEFVDTGAAEQATLHHQEFRDAGLFATQLSCAAADAADLLERIRGIYETAARDGIGVREFEQARAKLAARVVLAGERPRRRLFEVGGEWAHAGEYRSVADSLAIVDALTRDDLSRVLSTWDLAGPAATVIAGPEA
jgi:predicted Zn-dependent peptidase